jgi:hypothetical protein
MVPVLSLRALLAVSVGVAASLVVPAHQAIAEDGERHVILVNVLDRAGNQIRDLSAANFRGEYQKKPVSVVSAAMDRGPRRIALAVDTSASLMFGADARAAFQEAGALVSTLTPQHQVAIFSVSNVLRMHSNLTNDTATLQRALIDAGAQQPGGTALYDALLRLSDGFAGRSPSTLARRGPLLLLKRDPH